MMQRMSRELPTPRLVVDRATMQRNIQHMAEYAAAHGIGLRPHTKTHKTKALAQMQRDAGACGLTVAKAGEAQQMAQVADELLVAYPAADSLRCARLARLAKTKALRVAVDSRPAADTLSQAAADATIGVLVDIDVGMHRTGVQGPEGSLELAQYIDRLPHLRLDGIMFYPGHVKDPSAAEDKLREIDAILVEAIGQWARCGLNAPIVSGGSTPTARWSHHMSSITEIRPGTYIFHDMNCVHGGYAALHDCAARIVCTVVSDAVPGQVVIDAGTKTLTSDRCGPAPDSGHGYVVEFPRAKITHLTEEHGQVDVTNCEQIPHIGQRVHIIPNHICPCVNLQDSIWLRDDGEEQELSVDARGMVF